MARPQTRHAAQNQTLPDLDGPLGQNEFMELCRTDASQLWIKMIALCNNYDNKIEDLEADLAEAQINFQEQATELIGRTTERDQYLQQIALMAMRENTSSSQPSTRKSTKIPDPPELTDGKKPRFDDWLLLMKQKLSANADHFDTPELRMAYVASRTADNAREHLMPRMRDEAMNKYQDSDEMLEHLKTIYGDPNRVINAKYKFRNLFMKTSDRFHDFLSEFLRIAAEAEIKDDNWREELYPKLTTELQKLVMSEFIKNNSFNEFSEHCSQMSNHLEVIQRRTQRNRTFNPRTNQNTPDTTSSNTSRPRASTPRSATPRSKDEGSSTLGGRSLTPQEVERYMREGRCFNCGEHGHMRPECPKRKPNPQLQVLELDRTSSEEQIERDQGSGKDSA
jgi:hypothetical protein